MQEREALARPRETLLAEAQQNQASARNTPQGATPCLVFSRNRSPAYAVVPWEEFLRLQRAEE